MTTDLDRRVASHRKEIRQIVGLDEGVNLPTDESLAIETAALLVAAEARLHPEGWGDDPGRVTALAHATARAHLEAMAWLILSAGRGGDGR